MAQTPIKATLRYELYAVTARKDQQVVVRTFPVD